MTPRGVADRLRQVGADGGVVMLVWHNKVDARRFLKDDRKRPQGEVQAEKRIRTTPPPKEERKRRTKGTGDPEARKRGKGDPEARKRGKEEATATRSQVKGRIAAKLAEALRWRSSGMVEECWVQVHGVEELRGNRPLSAMVGNKRPVGGGGLA